MTNMRNENDNITFENNAKCKTVYPFKQNVSRMYGHFKCVYVYATVRVYVRAHQCVYACLRCACVCACAPVCV